MWETGESCLEFGSDDRRRWQPSKRRRWEPHPRHSTVADRAGIGQVTDRCFPAGAGRFCSFPSLEWAGLTLPARTNLFALSRSCWPGRLRRIQAVTSQSRLQGPRGLPGSSSDSISTAEAFSDELDGVSDFFHWRLTSIRRSLLPVSHDFFV